MEYLTHRSLCRMFLMAMAQHDYDWAQIVANRLQEIDNSNPKLEEDEK